MKKLSGDVSIVYLVGKEIIRALSLLFFCFINLSAQTLLNNFGISDFINTQSGYTQFVIIDYNKDGIEDLFLFGNQEKSFVIHEGLKDSAFSDPIRKFFFYPIDDIKWLNKSTKGDDYYIFVSRNKRLAGLVSFTKSYSLQLLHTIEFNSYPSSIKIVDLNNDGINEALVFGNNFNGLIKIRNEGYRLEAEPLIEQKVLSDLVIFDFNQDENEDIIAIDVLNNTLAFFEDSEISGFVKSREIEFDEPLNSIKKFNSNNNEFEDLVISKESGIEIFEGDSVYAFTNSVDYPFSFNPEKFLIADFNQDQKKDFVVIDDLDDKIVFWSNYESKSEFFNIEFSGIVSFRVLDKNGIKSLISISKKGKIQKISSETRWGNSFSLSMGGNPNNIKYISRNDAAYSNLLVDNTIDNSISVISLDSNGNIVNLENQPLLNSFAKFDFSFDPKQIIGYSTKNRLLEIINIDNIHGNVISPNFLYTRLNIDQLMVDKEINIQVLELDGNKLFHETIIQSEGKYYSDNIALIDSFVVASYITSDGQIFYWKNENYQYKFNRLRNGSAEEILRNSDIDSSNKNIIILEDQSDSKDLLITIVSGEQNEFVYFVNSDKVQKYQSDIKVIYNDDLAEQSIQFYSSIFDQKSLFVFNALKSKIYILEFDEKNNMLVLRNAIDAVDVNHYFVNDFFDKTYLVYTNNDNKCITFKVID